MLKPKRVLGLSGLLGLLAAAAFAIPASADLKGECIVDGEAKTVDKEEQDEGVQLVGQEGKFTFRSLLIQCVGDTDKDGIPEADVPPIIAQATGWYDNTVCGTGKAFGTVTQIVSAEPKFQAVRGEEFALQFVGLQGVFKWRDWDKPDVEPPKLPADSEDENKESYDGTPAGYILLSPPRPDGKPAPSPAEIEEQIANNECTKAFQATGTVTVHFAD